MLRPRPLRKTPERPTYVTEKRGWGKHKTAFGTFVRAGRRRGGSRVAAYCAAKHREERWGDETLN